MTQAETIRDDGGQAFPAAYTVGPNDDLYPPTAGMSLRDWFAGQVLASRLSSFEGMASMKASAARNSISLAQEAAEQAYDFADAMLETRK